MITNVTLKLSFISSIKRHGSVSHPVHCKARHYVPCIYAMSKIGGDHYDKIS